MSTTTRAHTDRADHPAGGPSDPTQDDGRAQPLWFVVAGREVLVRLTDKNFIVSTAITLVLLAGSFALQAVLAGHTSSVSVAATGPQAAQVLDQVDRLADQRGTAVDLTVTSVADPGTVTQEVRDGTADLGLVHAGDSWQLVGQDAPDPTVAALVREVVTSTALSTNAAAAGTSVDALLTGGTVEVQSLESSTDTGVRYAVGLVFAVLFYIASLLFGMTIASSVVEEKQSRVVEILVTAVPVRQLLLGKVAGNSVLALAQMVVFVGVGLVGLSFTSYADLLPAVAGASGWFLVFFLAGFVALACLWAAAGALATRNEDLQSTTPILTTILIAAMMVGLVGEGSVRTVASFVPIASTVAMPERLFAGDAAWWEPVVSLLVTLAFAGVAVVFGARLYGRTLLQTQHRLSLREAMRAQA